MQDVTAVDTGMTHCSIQYKLVTEEKESSVQLRILIIHVMIHKVSLTWFTLSEARV